MRTILRRASGPRLLVLALIAAMLSLASSLTLAQAKEEDNEPGLLAFTASIDFVTDYRSRGIAQTDQQETFQGSFKLSTAPGFYAGVWISGVGDKPSKNAETNYYLGITRQLNEGTVGDVGYIYYHYLTMDEDPELDYWELYGSLTFKDSLTFGVAYTKDYYAGRGELLYTYADFSTNFSEWLVFGFHGGYSRLNRIGRFSDGNKSYFDWGVSASTELLGFGLTVALVGTDIDSKDTCFGKADLCDTTAIFTLSKSFYF